MKEALLSTLSRTGTCCEEEVSIYCVKPLRLRLFVIGISLSQLVQINKADRLFILQHPWMRSRVALGRWETGGE